jgi:hypothetical protein
MVDPWQVSGVPEVNDNTNKFVRRNQCIVNLLKNLLQVSEGVNNILINSSEILATF